MGVACVQGRGGSSHTRLMMKSGIPRQNFMDDVSNSSPAVVSLFSVSHSHIHTDNVYNVCLGVWKGRKQPNRPRLCQLHGEEVGMFMRQRRHPGPRAFLSCTLFCFADGSRGRGDLLHIEGQRLLSNCRCVMSFGVHLQQVIVIILLLLICV